MTTLFHINQYNTDKQSLERKLEVLKKKPDVSGLVPTNAFSAVENKIPTVTKWSFF